MNMTSGEPAVPLETIVDELRGELLRDRDDVARAVRAALQEVVEADGADAVLVGEDPTVVTQRAAGQVQALAAAHFSGDVEAP